MLGWDRCASICLGIGFAVAGCGLCALALSAPLTAPVMALALLVLLVYLCAAAVVSILGALALVLCASPWCWCATLLGWQVCPTRSPEDQSECGSS